MAGLDWSQCPAVASVPRKVSGASVFPGTRMPVSTVFENLEAGMSVDEITEVFDVTREEVRALLAENVDKNIRYKQNLSGRKIAIVVLGNQEWPQFRQYLDRVADAVNSSVPGSYVEVEIPFS